MTETIPRSTRNRMPWLTALLVPLVAISWLGCNFAPQDADPSRDILTALRGGLIGFVDPGSASGRHSRVSGWYEPEQKSEGGTFCWTSGRTATLRLDCHEPKDSHIVLRDSRPTTPVTHVVPVPSSLHPGDSEFSPPNENPSRIDNTFIWLLSFRVGAQRTRTVAKTV